jgi:hypothetical protein
MTLMNDPNLTNEWDQHLGVLSKSQLRELNDFLPLHEYSWETKLALCKHRA